MTKSTAVSSFVTTSPTAAVQAIIIRFCVRSSARCRLAHRSQTIPFVAHVELPRLLQPGMALFGSLSFFDLHAVYSTVVR